MCAKLFIFIDPAPGSAGELEGMRATADVLPVSSASTRRPPVSGLVVPLDAPSTPAITALPPGEWLVRARMPSGELLHQPVSMGDESMEVRLRSESAAPAGLGFEFASGLLSDASNPLEALVSETTRIQHELTSTTTSILKGLSAEGRPFRLESFGNPAPERRLYVSTWGGSPSKPSLPLDNLLGDLKFGGLPTPVQPRKLEEAHLEPASSDLRLYMSESAHLSTVVAELDPAALSKALKPGASPGTSALAALMFGRKLHEQRVALVGEGPLTTALIDLPDKAEAMANPADRANGKIRRSFAWLRADASGQTSIACIPRVWMSLGTRKQADMRILVSPHPEDPAHLRMTLAVHDPNVASALGFLQKGDLGSAERLALECIEMLDQKRLNPYAAAAAAYVLVHGRSSAPQYWQQWIRNLCAWFPGIPDGPILLATLGLQRGDHGLPPRGHRLSAKQQRDMFVRAKAQILQAICSGPPMFRMGIRLLTENIDILHSLAQELDEPTDELARAALLVRWMRLRVDTSQPFTVLRV